MLVLATFLIFVLLCIFAYRTLIIKRNRCDVAWHAVAALLKNRHELVVELIELMKVAAPTEVVIIERVTHLREIALEAHRVHGVKAQIRAEAALESGIQQLIAKAERYTALRGMEQLLKLTTAFRNNEESMIAATLKYNDAVRAFNTAVEKPPGNLVAGFGHFNRKNFFTSQDSSRELGSSPTPIAVHY